MALRGRQGALWAGGLGYRGATLHPLNKKVRQPGWVLPTSRMADEGPQCGKPDFVLLDQVTMEDFMENLKLRWARGTVSTSPGRGLHTHAPLPLTGDRRAVAEQEDCCLSAREQSVLQWALQTLPPTQQCLLVTLTGRSGCLPAAQQVPAWAGWAPISPVGALGGRQALPRGACEGAGKFSRSAAGRNGQKWPGGGQKAGRSQCTFIPGQPGQKAVCWRELGDRLLGWL